MDAQVINPADKIPVQVSRPAASAVGSDKSAPPAGPVPGASVDTVTLSQRGQVALGSQVGQSGENKSASELRKLALTDDNQVVIKIVDGQTQKVVRQIPPEAAVRLRQAIQDTLAILSQTGELVDTSA